MTIINRLLTVALGLFLVSAGVAKITTGHVFQYIEFQSGVDLFYPFVNNLTGIAEIAAGAAILYRPTRLAGSLLAAVLMAGAVAFHLSPWLGASIPTGLSDGAEAPWDAADFAATTTSVTFFLAIVIGGRSLALARREYLDRKALASPTDERPASIDDELVRA